MAQPVVSRSQRRIERKQLTLIIVLILAVAGISFSLGVMYGKRGGLPGLVDDTEKPRLPMVTQVKPPPKPTGQEVEQEPEKLTFYDNLPKGKQAPLGSGINLPPQDNLARKKTATPVERKKPAAPKTVKKSVPAPVASAEGAFVVQVASFRTSADADKLATRLKTYDLTTFVEKADLGEKGTWHRVLSGPYKTRENADQAARLLREKERLSALVRQR